MGSISRFTRALPHTLAMVLIVKEDPFIAFFIIIRVKDMVHFGVFEVPKNPNGWVMS